MTKKIVVPLLLLFLTSCSFSGWEPDISTKDSLNVEIPVEETEIVKVEMENLPKVDSFEEAQALEDQFAYFEAKNGVIINKWIVDLVAWNCDFFEGKKTYYVEEDGTQVERWIYEFKTHAYAAIEEWWCPGTESKDEKIAMIDMIINGQVPEKMKQFSTIESLREVDPEVLNLDTSSEEYRPEILAYAGLYMLTIPQEDTQTFTKHIDMYNDYLKYLSNDIYGKAMWDFYHPILFATASREGWCSQYINDYIIDYWTTQ